MNNSTDPNPSTATSNNCSRLTAVINAASVDCCAQEFEFGEPFVIQDGKVLLYHDKCCKRIFFVFTSDNLQLVVSENFTLPEDMIFGEAQAIAITTYR